MSSTDPNTTAASASTATTAPAATTTKKPASLKAVTGFGKLDPNTLANTAHHIAKGVGGHPLYFPNPPIDPAALDAAGNTLPKQSSLQWMAVRLRKQWSRSNTS